MNRHLSRTLAMQIIYEWDFRDKKNFDKILDRSIEIFKKDLDLKYVCKLVYGVKGDLRNLDKKIILVLIYLTNISF